VSRVRQTPARASPDSARAVPPGTRPGSRPVRPTPPPSRSSAEVLEPFDPSGASGASGLSRSSGSDSSGPSGSSARPRPSGKRPGSGPGWPVAAAKLVQDQAAARDVGAAAAADAAAATDADAAGVGEKVEMNVQRRRFISLRCKGKDEKAKEKVEKAKAKLAKARTEAEGTAASSSLPPPTPTVRRRPPPVVSTRSTPNAAPGTKHPACSTQVRRGICTRSDETKFNQPKLATRPSGDTPHLDPGTQAHCTLMDTCLAVRLTSTRADRQLAPLGCRVRQVRGRWTGKEAGALTPPLRRRAA